MKQIGRYTILEELGQGAMGAVYKASDPMMDRVVAVKTILATALSGPLAADYRERFFREARAAGRLAHPGIVTVYDVAEQEGTPYLVMEFIHGQTLEKIMETGERFDTDRVIELGQQIAEALDYAHKGGVIHRDIKPANIMITADGRPKIADFGVAKLSGAQVTTTGQLMGTPAFMAPEQFTGAPIDGRADLFALGVVLYWLATGDRPFTGETLMAMSYKIVHTDPVPPRKLNPAIPRDLENVILKCMEKDPAARYQSGEALARDLRAMREGRALETLNRERAARAANIEKTELSVPTPADDSFDTAETVAVLKPSPRATASSAPGMRARATVPMAPQATVAAPPTTVSEPPARRSGSRAWIVFATIVIVATLAAWVLKKREVVIVTPPQQQSQQQPAPTHEPASIPAPPAPGLAVEPPEVTKAKADALRAAQDAKKESAKIASAAKHPSGLNLEITARERAMIVLTPDGGPAANYQMQPGNSVSAKADKEMKLFTDNAGALQWKMNGKSQPTLGTGHTALTARITETGAETIWSGDPTAIAKKYRQFGPGKIPEGSVPSMPPVVDPERIRSQVAQQLKGTMAQLKIHVQVPGVLEVDVMMDGKPLFHRAAASESATAPEARLNAGERWVLPGKHEFEVHVSRPGARGRWNQTVAGDFSVGQQRSLHVRMRPLNQPNILNQLSVEIE